MLWRGNILKVYTIVCVWVLVALLFIGGCSTTTATFEEPPTNQQDDLQNDSSGGTTLGESENGTEMPVPDEGYCEWVPLPESGLNTDDVNEDSYADDWGVRIDVPGSWIFCNEGNIISADEDEAHWRFQNRLGNGGAGVYVTEYFDSLQDFIEFDQGEFVWGISEVLGDPESTVFAGFPAQKFIFRDKKGGLWMQIYAWNEGLGYSFWYSNSNNFYSQLDIVEMMRNSVEFIPPETSAVEFTTYEYPAEDGEWGVRLEYPSNYIIAEQITSSWLFNPPRRGSGGLWVTEYYDSLADYKKQEDDTREEEYVISKTHEAVFTDWVGLRAFRIDFTDENNDRWLEVMAVDQNGNAFHFWYVAPEYVFQLNVDTIQMMLDSVEFIAP